MMMLNRRCLHGVEHISRQENLEKMLQIFNKVGGVIRTFSVIITNLRMLLVPFEDQDA